MSGSPSISIDALLAQTSWLRRLASHLVSDPDQVHDLVQETLARALQHPTQGIRRGWLSRVMRNLAKNRYRKADIEAWHVHSASKALEWSPEDIEWRVGLQKQVAEAVFGLEEPYRTAITLFYFENLTAEEIARRQRTTPANVRKQLSRGRDMLRARLDREFGSREGWRVVFLAMLRKGAAAPLAGGLGKIIALTAAALAILSLFFWSRVRSPGEERKESASNSAVVVDEGRLRTANDSLNDSTPDHRQELGGQIRTADPERIRGLIVDASDRPLEGARIDVFRDDASSYSWDPYAEVIRESVATTNSDAQGEFAVHVPPGRPFELEASADGYGTTTLGYRRAGETVVIRLLAGAVLEGRATRESSETPASDARVELSTLKGTFEGGRLFLRTGQTDKTGRFHFEALPAGIPISVRLMPSSDGAPVSDTVTLEPGGTASIYLAVKDGGTIHGRVFDAETHMPIPNAEVGETRLSNRIIHADEKGEYVYKGLREVGPVVLMARADGFTSNFKAFRIDTTDELPEHFDFPLTRCVRLRGRVVDSEGRPIEGAYIAAISNRPLDPSLAEAVRIRGRTGDRGRFELPDVSGDLAVTLLARHEGSGTLATPCVAQSSGASAVEVGDLILPPGFALQGSVLDEAGDALKNWTVTLTPADLDSDGRFNVPDPIPLNLLKAALERTSRTDDQGQFTFLDVSSGVYSIAVDPPDSSARIAQLVSIPESASIVVRVPRLESIAGQVLDADGRGVSGIWVTAVLERDELGLSYAGITAANGDYSVNGLPAGTYRVSADKLRGSQAIFAQPLRNVVAGARNATIRLEKTVEIHGKLDDVDGRGIGGGGVLGRVPGQDGWFGTLTKASGEFVLYVPVDVSVDLVGYRLGIKCRPISTMFEDRSGEIAHQRILSSSSAEVTLQLP